LDTLEMGSHPTRGGHRVIANPEAATLMSEVTNRIYAHLADLNARICQSHGVKVEEFEFIRVEASDFPEGPFTQVPWSEIDARVIHVGKLGADRVLMTALNWLSQALSFPVAKWNELQAANPGGNHQRWQSGDCIKRNVLALLRLTDRQLGQAAYRLTQPQFTDGPNDAIPPEPLIKALSLTTVYAGRVHAAVKKLENLREDGELTPAQCRFCWPQPDRFDGVEGQVRDEIGLEAMAQEREPWWRPLQVEAIRQVRLYRAAIDEATQLLPSVVEIMDNRFLPIHAWWTAGLRGELRLARGAVAAGHPRDISVLDCPFIGFGVCERLEQAIVPIQRRMQELITAQKHLVAMKLDKRSDAQTAELSKGTVVQAEPQAPQQESGIWYPSFWYRQATKEFHPGGAEIAIKALKRAGTQGKVLCRQPTSSDKYWWFELESVCACDDFQPFVQSIRKGHDAKWPIHPKGMSSDEDAS